jgi:hypothetical protein
MPHQSKAAAHTLPAQQEFDAQAGSFLTSNILFLLQN